MKEELLSADVINNIRAKSALALKLWLEEHPSDTGNEARGVYDTLLITYAVLHCQEAKEEPMTNFFPYRCRDGHDLVGWRGAGKSCPVCIVIAERNNHLEFISNWLTNGRARTWEELTAFAEGDPLTDSGEMPRDMLHGPHADCEIPGWHVCTTRKKTL